MSGHFSFFNGSFYIQYIIVPLTFSLLTRADDIMKMTRLPGAMEMGAYHCTN